MAGRGLPGELKEWYRAEACREKRKNGVRQRPAGRNGRTESGRGLPGETKEQNRPEACRDNRKNRKRAGGYTNEEVGLEEIWW